MATPVVEASDKGVKEAVRKRAKRIYEQGGRIEGHDEENWLRAEAEVAEAERRKHPKRARIMIKAKGMVYTVEYDPETNDYQPGELQGKPVRVSIAKGRMFITRENGAVLETLIVKQEFGQAKRD